MRKISLALSLLLLSGCAEFAPSWDGGSSRNIDPYARSDFDELLAFGANMANISPSSRAKVCSTLLKRQNDSPGIGIQLHLMVGRLLSDACGEIPKILEGVSAIPYASLSDERMQKLIAIDKETLKRMQNVPKKSRSVERKPKKAQAVPQSKETKGSNNNNETRLLREKLEAIRSMEKQMDESGGAN